MNHNQEIGIYGEKIAKEYLINKGYEILDVNVKLSFKEIDIVAKKNNTIIIVEVKTRISSALGEAYDAMTLKKLNNLKKAAENYININKYYNYDIGIDLITIDIEKISKKYNISHYIDIF